MSSDTQAGPEACQVVSDLGQLTAFVDPMKMRILRVLQHQEATTEHLAEIVGEGKATVSDQIHALLNLRLITKVDQKGRDGTGQDIYRATARVYNLRPEPREYGTLSASIAAATLDSVTKEVVGSLTQWPSQRMNYEGRRTRMSYDRATEFNDKLLELIAEYWGSPDQPVDENPADPLMAFIGAWYRFPEEP
jgi:DNA-binding transcriptional ArsR family regulator